MTEQQLCDAMIRRVPVKYNGINYVRITAVIRRVNTKGNCYISAELLDKSTSQTSIVIARGRNVKLLEG